MKCPKCGSNIPLYRAKLAFQVENKHFRLLAQDGPITGDDITGGLSVKIRDLVEKLKAPAGSSQKSRPRVNTGVVYYLPGQERAAVELFLEENTEWVRSCINDQFSPLRKNWSEFMWCLLLEQYYALGYDE